MCKKAVEDKPNTLKVVPDHLKIRDMCERAVDDHPWQLRHVSDQFKTQGICERVRREPYKLDYIPDQFKTKEMCNEAVRRKPWLLEYEPDWLVTQEQVKIWHGDDYYCNDNKIVEWYEGYKKRKAQKAQIKEELFSIMLGIHQDGGAGVFLKTRKKRQKNCGS